MRKYRLLVLLVCILLCAAACAPAQEPSAPESVPAPAPQAGAEAAPSRTAQPAAEEDDMLPLEAAERDVSGGLTPGPALPADYAARFPALPFAQELARRQQDGYITLECAGMGQAELFNYCNTLEEAGFSGSMGSYRKEADGVLLRFDAMIDAENDHFLLTYGMEPLA